MFISTKKTKQKTHFVKNQNLKLDRCMKTVFLPAVSPLNDNFEMISTGQSLVISISLLTGHAARVSAGRQLLV